MQRNDIRYSIPNKYQTSIRIHIQNIWQNLRREKGLPGIDFTKAVVIQQLDIECQCTIDKKEWIELNKNLMTIVANFTEYLKKFAGALENGDFIKLPIFKFSSLQYFIDDVKSVVNSL